MKTFKILIASSFLSLTLFTTTFASGPKIILNNKELPVQALSQDQRVLVPLRAVFQSLNAAVDYDHATKTITANQKGKIIVLKVDSKTATVNGDPITLDVPARIIANTTLVPVRFIAKSLGARVGWDNNTVIIDTPHASTQEDDQVLYDVEVTEEITLEDHGTIPTLTIALQEKYLEITHITQLGENDFDLPKEMPGYIGPGYNIGTRGSFEKGILSFVFNPEFLDIKDFQPAIYYFDRDQQDLTILENQKINLKNHTISVTIHTPGIYIVLNDTAFMEVWDVDTSQEDLILDTDGDGIPDYYEVNGRYFNGVKIGSDPFNPDTDGDGLLDGEEAFMKTDENH